MADPKNSGKATFTLTKPAASKATITNTKDLDGKFTPDVPGTYIVGVTVKNAAGLSSAADYVKITAGTYIGVNDGKCATCHAKYTEEWAKTAHATLFSRELDNKVDGPAGVKPSAAGYITHYSETCARCHTTGFYPAPYNGAGGYFDAKAKANWTFPTWKQIDGAFTKANPSNWDAAPAAVKNMGTIGCEVCHGPAVRARQERRQDSGSLLGRRRLQPVPRRRRQPLQGLAARQLQAQHRHQLRRDQRTLRARPACAATAPRASSTFVANPKDQAPGATRKAPSAAPPATIRTPRRMPTSCASSASRWRCPFELKKDVGLSAICFTCHNGRVNAEGSPSSPAPRTTAWLPRS